MKKNIGCLVVAIVLMAQPVIGGAKDFYPKVFADIAKEASKSVVIVLGGSDLLSENRTIFGDGAGFFVSENLIITAEHIISKIEEMALMKMMLPEISVELYTGQLLGVKIVARNPEIDIAILSVEGDVRGIRPLKLGDSSKLEVGDIAMAIGHPFNLWWSVSTGIISGLREMDDSSFWKLIQTDTAINPGNSGGPLFNLDGEVIGIVFSSLKNAGGIAFAIPINAVKELLALVGESEKK